MYLRLHILIEPVYRWYIWTTMVLSSISKASFSRSSFFYDYPRKEVGRDWNLWYQIYPRAWWP